MNGLVVLSPGMLSLLQDGGRYGHHGIGLTTGGPLDRLAMSWANRILGNSPEVTAIEASFGGLKLESQVQTRICVTGGDQPLSINGHACDTWRSYCIAPGDRIELGFARKFCRSYLAVAGGFQIAKQFGSASTVVREGIGGLNGGKLARADVLPVTPEHSTECATLPEAERPQYSQSVRLRLIPGYQIEHFSRLQQQRFFHNDYLVTERADRMGYRLEGPTISCNLSGMLSEGICMGAVQIPADGQPIVLLRDRQTIGGYPKIGSVLSMDCAMLAQQMPGARIRFEAISTHEADNAFNLAHSQYHRQEPQPLGD